MTNPPNLLLYEQRDHVVTLTLNDPERRNPLTGNNMADELLSAIDRIHRDATVRAVILTGAGAAFSSGGDIRKMAEQSSGAVDPVGLRTFYRMGIQRVPLALYNLEVPVIAAVNGPAVGAGLDLACMCDIRIASEQARFAESFIKMGLIPGDGGAWLLQRAIGPARAAEMTFTGDIIDARQAAEWGLVSRVVPHDQLLPAAFELAQRIAANPPMMNRLSKRLMREAQHTRLDTHLEMAALAQPMAHQTADHREAVDAFLNKRKPNFTGR